MMRKVLLDVWKNGERRDMTKEGKICSGKLPTGNLRDEGREEKLPPEPKGDYRRN